MRPPAGPEAPTREWLLRLLCAATFLVFFQAFMIAPLIAQLAREFGSSTGVVGLAVPAYLVPYGVETLLWGPLSDRIGRAAVIAGSATAFVALTALTALADSAGAFVAVRAVTAVGASGVVPISLALIGDLFPYERRGHALGWLFGAMAGGMAFGSSAGALLEPVIGWRGLFLGVAGLAAIVLVVLVAHRSVLDGDAPRRRDRPPTAQCGTDRGERACGDECGQGTARDHGDRGARHGQRATQPRGAVLVVHVGSPPSWAGAMRSQQVRAAALSAASERASITRSATRGSPTE